ncbi:MAG: hypothetical protein NXH73_00580 [Flavobacteriaceae bacterium]|nr:hypothetical protein [Flavobacteriaceae bacterium]
MIKIYCEDGAMTKEVKKLKNDSSILLISFPFENSNKKTFSSKKPTELLASSGFTLASSSIRLSDTIQSEKYEEIKNIVGEKNFNDIKHIDTAYKEKCRIFISPDKKDIVNNGEEFNKITGIKFFYSEDIEEIKKYIYEIK